METKIVKLNVTTYDIAKAQGGSGDNPEEYPGVCVWAEMPAHYDHETVTASDVVHDPAIRKVPEPAPEPAKTYTWYFSSAALGVCATREEAEAELLKHICQFDPVLAELEGIGDLDDLVSVLSPDGGTTYYYVSQEAADEDGDGAYAWQISEE